jgi:hypothetical protein
MNTNIAKVKSICETVTTEIGASSLDPAAITILSLLNNAISSLCENQQKLINSKQVTQPPPALVDTAGSQKRPRHEYNDTNMVDLRSVSQTRTSRAPPPRIEVNPEVKKFKDTVREAEKSTLVFNLNLGRSPVINHDTISTRVTKALTDKAASIDGVGPLPKEDTVAALDDVLSIVKGMKFYGRATKSYINSKDSLSGSYCTIPVRYDFTDKESRLYAETVLRDRCKVQCSTPYPLILREAIKQLVDETKARYRSDYVKVNVDTSSMTLIVYKRPMLPPGDKSKKVWSTVGAPIPIPDACLDVSARRIPENFVVSIHGNDAHMSDSDTDSLELQGAAANKPAGSKSPPKKAASPKKK